MHLLSPLHAFVFTVAGFPESRYCLTIHRFPEMLFGVRIAEGDSLFMQSMRAPETLLITDVGARKAAVFFPPPLNGAYSVAFDIRRAGIGEDGPAFEAVIDWIYKNHTRLEDYPGELHVHIE